MASSREERDLERLFASSSELLCVIEETGEIRRVNPACEAHPSLRPGSTLADAVHESDRALLEDALSQLARSEPRVTVACRMTGGAREIEWSLVAGESAIYAFGRDVTEERRLARAAMASRRALASIASAAPLGETLALVAHVVESELSSARCTVLVADHDAGVLRVRASPSMPEEFNRAFDRLPIAEGSAVCGTAAFRGAPHVSADVFADPHCAPYLRVAERCGIRSCWSFPFFDAEGRVLGAFGVYFGEARAPAPAEAELASGAAYLAGIAVRSAHAASRVRDQAALLDAANDAIVVRNSAGLVTYWNAAAEAMYGRSAGEALGMSFELAINPRKEALPDARRALAAESEWLGELTHVAKDGREIVALTRWTRIADPRGDESMLSIATDVTERKKLEQQYLRSQRMESIGTLASGIAHDLNNVLTPILVSVEALKPAISSEVDPEAFEFVEAIETSVARGAEMLRQVLSFARGETGQRNTVRSYELVLDVVRVARDLLPKTIVVQSRASRDLPSVLGNRTQLQQVLMNLVINARDAMPHGGTLSIEAERVEVDATELSGQPQAVPGPHVLIAISDTGAGIPPELLERVFEPFFTTKETGKGTGLGLSTVLGIVKSHSGFVRVESELERGTSFAVYLPARAEDSPRELASAPRAEPPRGRGELVLLVDDEALILAIAHKSLEAFGYRVLTASDGAQALRLYVEHQHDVAVVLTDMGMPVMDGAGLARELQKLNPNVRVIAMSGLDLGGTLARAGIQHFLPKPFTTAAMLEVLHRALES
jgi:PAS domain S-box-containing protein